MEKLQNHRQCITYEFCPSPYSLGEGLLINVFVNNQQKYSQKIVHKFRIIDLTTTQIYFKI